LTILNISCFGIVCLLKVKSNTELLRTTRRERISSLNQVE